MYHLFYAEPLSSTAELGLELDKACPGWNVPGLKVRG